MSNEKDIKTVLDEAVGAATEIMTTEIFHAQLVKNTEAINKNREAYETKKIMLQRNCDLLKDLADKRLQTLQKDRTAFKQEINSKEASFSERERDIRNFRRKATEDYLVGMMKAKNKHAMINLELQNERHKIFEAYRNSGGQILPKTLSKCTQKDGADQSLKMEE